MSQHARRRDHALTRVALATAEIDRILARRNLPKEPDPLYNEKGPRQLADTVAAIRASYSHWGGRRTVRVIALDLVNAKVVPSHVALEAVRLVEHEVHPLVTIANPPAPGSEFERLMYPPMDPGPMGRCSAVPVSSFVAKLDVEAGQLVTDKHVERIEPTPLCGAYRDKPIPERLLSRAGDALARLHDHDNMWPWRMAEWVLKGTADSDARPGLKCSCNENAVALARTNTTIAWHCCSCGVERAWVDWREEAEVTAFVPDTGWSERNVALSLTGIVSTSPARKRAVETVWPTCCPCLHLGADRVEGMGAIRCRKCSRAYQVPE